MIQKASPPPPTGTPALRAALREQGFTTRYERGIELWKMLHHAHAVLTSIALEIEFNAAGEPGEPPEEFQL